MGIVSYKNKIKKISLHSMSQLDKFTFFTQIFWLLLLISIFYYSLVNYFLSNLVSLLKLRYKVLFNLKADLNILSIFLSKNNILYHFNIMSGKYSNIFFTKIKKYIKLRCMYFASFLQIRKLLNKELLVINEEFILAISYFYLIYLINIDLLNSYISLIKLKYLIIFIKKTKFFIEIRRILGTFQHEVYYIFLYKIVK